MHISGNANQYRVQVFETLIASAQWPWDFVYPLFAVCAAVWQAAAAKPQAVIDSDLQVGDEAFFWNLGQMLSPVFKISKSVAVCLNLCQTLDVPDVEIVHISPSFVSKPVDGVCNPVSPSLPSLQFR